MPTLSPPELPEGLGLEGYIILAGTLIILLQLVVSPLLKILGFGKIGIVAGSIAAKVQSLLRIVVSGSIFAILQSAGMGGYGAKVIADVLTVAGLLTVYVGVVLAAWSKWKTGS
ncbi:uncharacterized protein B0T23DRAFT_219475 [Neurospora hispaniola]|uniref:Uncharacterized protein n=1 Tax=Neurospora hispaniola TaxID=588809 RepID=A0AAJ0MNN2_9PEZI|nr:hypothetical protein B0T23DRAFT_219475 [Neurospora hispaniola]